MMALITGVILGSGIGLVLFHLIQSSLPAKPYLLWLSAEGAPGGISRGTVKGAGVRTKWAGRDVTVPIDKDHGHPFKGSTLYLVDQKTATTVSYRGIEADKSWRGLDGWRIVSEAQSAMHDRLQRGEPEGMFGFLERAAPLLLILILVLLTVIMVAVGKFAEWW